MTAKLSSYLIQRWASVACMENTHHLRSFLHSSTVLHKQLVSPLWPWDINNKPRSLKATGCTVLITKSHRNLGARLYCKHKGKRDIDTCFTFVKVSRNDQEKYVKENRLCWGCLRPSEQNCVQIIKLVKQIKSCVHRTKIKSATCPVKSQLFV